jgi:hypothetical protein
MLYSVGVRPTRFLFGSTRLQDALREGTVRPAWTRSAGAPSGRDPLGPGRRRRLRRLARARSRLGCVPTTPTRRVRALRPARTRRVRAGAPQSGGGRRAHPPGASQRVRPARTRRVRAGGAPQGPPTPSHCGGSERVRPARTRSPAGVGGGGRRVGGGRTRSDPVAGGGRRRRAAGRSGCNPPDPVASGRRRCRAAGRRGCDPPGPGRRRAGRAPRARSLGEGARRAAAPETLLVFTKILFRALLRTQNECILTMICSTRYYGGTITERMSADSCPRP